MAQFSVYPPEYLLLNSQQSKQLGLVLEIDGVDALFSNVPIFTRVRYGDPGIVYGEPGLVYGGLRVIDGVKSYIMMDQGLTLQQKIEPEQGRGAISTMSIDFLDKDRYMSRLIAPGIIVDELLGNRLCTFKLGFVNSSYPQDYFTVFRGFVTSITSAPGKVTLQFSDANVKRRQMVGFSLKTALASSITNVATVIPVDDASGLYRQILDQNGIYDPIVLTYIKVEDEVMLYGPTGISGNNITVTRGQRVTSAVAHAAGADVTNGIQFQDNCITLALKLMLSGWNGPWITGQEAEALGNTLDVTRPFTNVILITQDADVDLGIVIGDQVIVSGSAASNDGSYIITDIQDQGGDFNNLLFIDTNLTPENPATTVSLAFRSKYDTLPVAWGIKNTPKEVDVRTHEAIRDQYFASGIYRLNFYLVQPQSSAKSFIESQCLLPFGIYAITRFGRISLGVTKPPLASDKLVYLDNTTISNPDQITIQRATNTRRFFNIIQYSYDKDDSGIYASTKAYFDSTSLSQTNVFTTLTIPADGVKTFLGGNLGLNSRAQFLLNRYKQGAFELNLKVNWAVGSLIEVTDPVVVVDDGTLQISNFDTGERNLGTALFETIQRTINVKEGNVTLTVLSNLGIQFGERFATISPSSTVTTGSTTTTIQIQDSYGALYPGNEQKKWIRFFGLPITLHSPDYSYVETTTLTGFSPADTYQMIVNPPLSGPPPAGTIVEVPDYPATDTDPNTQALYKLLFCFLDPTLTVVTGTSNTVFDVSAPDAAKLQVDMPILIHNSDYTILSPEVTVTDVTGTTITVGTSLGFTPAAGQLVELVGFLDGGGPYRFI